MSKIIVDTSFWIEFFNGNLEDNTSKTFRNEMENERVVITDIIFHEILIGSRDIKEYDLLLNLFSPIDKLRISNEQLDDYNRFAWRLSKNGLLGKYTDASIAYLANYYKYPILSLDKYFHKISRKGFIEAIIF